jgi:hypothetical protein
VVKAQGCYIKGAPLGRQTNHRYYGHETSAQIATECCKKGGAAMRSHASYHPQGVSCLHGAYCSSTRSPTLSA